MEQTKRVSWVQSGHSIDVDVTAAGYTAYVDGKRENGSTIQPPPTSKKSMFESRGAVGSLGNLIIYRERAQELEEIRARLIAQKPLDPLDEFRRLERALFASIEDARTWQDRHAYPSVVYANQKQAQDALNAWRVANQDLYDAEMKRRQDVEQARRDSLKVDPWTL